MKVLELYYHGEMTGWEAYRMGIRAEIPKSLAKAVCEVMA